MQFPMIPLQRRAFTMPVKLPQSRYHADFESEKPFFNILNDSGVASRFLEAVAADREDAWAFVSKNFVNAIDLDALRDVLGGSEQGRIYRASFNRDPKNCSTSSVLVMNPERGEKSILHLHMIREPDSFGQWKIYGVEQE